MIIRIGSRLRVDNYKIHGNYPTSLSLSARRRQRTASNRRRLIVVFAVVVVLVGVGVAQLTEGSSRVPQVLDVIDGMFFVHLAGQVNDGTLDRKSFLLELQLDATKFISFDLLESVVLVEQGQSEEKLIRDHYSRLTDLVVCSRARTNLFCSYRATSFAVSFGFLVGLSSWSWSFSPSSSLVAVSRAASALLLPPAPPLAAPPLAAPPLVAPVPPPPPTAPVPPPAAAPVPPDPPATGVSKISGDEESLAVVLV